MLGGGAVKGSKGRWIGGFRGEGRGGSLLVMGAASSERLGGLLWELRSRIAVLMRMVRIFEGR